MPVLLKCPGGHRLKVPSKHAGRTVACPVCQQPVRVPQRPADARSEEPPTETGQSNSSHGETPTPRTSPIPSSNEGIGDSPPLSTNVPPEPNATTYAESDPAQFVFDDSQVRVQPQLDAAEFSVATFLRDQSFIARWMAVACLAFGFVCAIPGCWQLWEQVQVLSAGSHDRWVYLCLAGVVIQLAIAGLFWMVPDWSTAWLVALLAIGKATIYAGVLALTMFAHQEHSLVHQLGLLDEALADRVQAWCLFVVCGYLIQAYALARFSVRWRQVAHTVDQLD